MNSFIRQLELERRRLEAQIEQATKKLDSAPEGSLSIRRRKRGTSYYRNTVTRKGKDQLQKQTNITTDSHLIQQLTDKVIQKKILGRAQHNLLYLGRLLDNYNPTEIDEIKLELGEQYLEALEKRKQEFLAKQRLLDYPKAPYDSRYHVHETDCGEFVRSKSEQIILNALTPHTQFVTHYEEEFIYKVPVEGLNRVYPDFTIILPNGKRIIWEHWGRLDDPEYCKRNALKLCLYQRNGYVLGDNLIITMDDHQGNVSSALVTQAIQQILSKM